MADNVPITPGSGATVSTEEVTTLNEQAVAAQHLQRIALALRTANGAAIDLPGDATNGLKTQDAAAATLLTAIAASVDGLEGFTDGLEALLGRLPSGGAASEATLASVLAGVDGVEALLGRLPSGGAASEASLASVLSAVDGLEGFTDGVEALLTAISGSVDGLETNTTGLATDTVLQAVRDRIGALSTPEAGSVNAQLASILGAVDGLEGFLDGVEGLLGRLPSGGAASEATLASVLTSVDGLEALLAAALTVTDGSGALTVDGTVAVSGTVPVTDNGGSLTVDGTVTANRPTASSATVSAVAVNASNVTLSASNSSRKGWMVYNDATAVLYVKFGATASTSSFTVAIPAGGFYEMPPGFLYTGQIDGIWASASGTGAKVTEL